MNANDAEIANEQLLPLKEFLSRIPAIEGSIGGGLDAEGWWVKFGINTEHGLAWNTVQELGYVLNYLSIDERLPTVFMPVSPPPYLNGGPEYLSWVIECRSAEFPPSKCAKRLEDLLPQPVDDTGSWATEE